MTSGSGFSAMLLALALTLVGCLHDSPAEENFWGIELPGEVATDFTLVNQYNASFSLNETVDRVVVMTFIYTHCPDVCPAVTYQLTKLQEALGDDYGTSVEILSITVDPERDTAEHLKESKVVIGVDVGAGGTGTATVWTCDLSAEYVRINADYRT